MACDGKPFRRDGSVCGVCGGKETFAVDQCPRTLLRAEVMPAIEAYSLLKETKTWPNGNGWRNEPAIEVDAVRFLRGEEALSGVMNDG